ncbi:MAG: LysM peptidoglycan-binding domain-containing protein [Verrucomicrobiaceae bacterium]|nr:LysM peptidoglycan-binding domain-containing protein [Verrucomicrobiaceae bacterium]NCF91967.1 LysM peptidoglycan-binding domain-containing protein [Verrucomicrobiaceae bacterium]
MKPNSNGSLRYHVVRRGDTLFSLSRRYGVTLYSIRRENGLDSFTIRVGQVLRMPASKN